MSRTPNLYEVIKAGVDSALDDLHTAMPAVVESYDASTQLAEVVPAIMRRFFKPDGTEDKRTFPKISNVPVCFPRAGDHFISFPIKQGDYVLLVFSERSIDQWLEKGDKQDPVITTKHDLSDAIAIAGVYPKTKKLANAHADHIVIGHDGPASPRAYFKSGEIALGAENPSEFVALAQKVLTELQSIRTWGVAHTHVVPGVLTGPASVTSNVALPVLSAPNSVAAQKVKAE